MRGKKEEDKKKNKDTLLLAKEVKTPTHMNLKSLNLCWVKWVKILLEKNSKLQGYEGEKDKTQWKLDLLMLEMKSHRIYKILTHPTLSQTPILSHPLNDLRK